MKKYKKYQLLFITNILIITLFITFLLYTSIKSYDEYIKLNAFYVTKDVVNIILSDKDLKVLEKNKYLYLNSKKKKVEILSITKNIYKKEIFYHQVLLKLNNINKNTVLNISMFNKKEKIIMLFREFLKEE